MSTTANSTRPAEAPTWRVLLAEARASLSSEREARWIAEEVAKRSPAELVASIDASPDRATRDRFAKLVAERANGMPLQRVLGHWQFRTLDLLVDRRALVPRPETEVLVTTALDELVAKRASSFEPVVVDLGTGSGAIACALVVENQSVHVVAVDVSNDALGLAAENRARLPASAASRLELRHGDWYDALDPALERRISLIVSNPPYVGASEWADLDPVVRDYDPRSSLVAGARGTEAIDFIVSGAARWLEREGALVVEIAPHQAAHSRARAIRAGASDVSVKRDLAGRDRVLVVRW